jgi:hypothetical protein
VPYHRGYLDDIPGNGNVGDCIDGHIEHRLLGAEAAVRHGTDLTGADEVHVPSYSRSPTEQRVKAEAVAKRGDASGGD